VLYEPLQRLRGEELVATVVILRKYYTWKGQKSSKKKAVETLPGGVTPGGYRSHRFFPEIRAFQADVCTWIRRIDHMITEHK
jgi:hypothetical protein